MAAELRSGVDRIAEAFTGHGRRAALMPYLMGGYPNVEDSLDVAREYVAGGADLVELGVPYSDPLADGPVIQAAGREALEAGTTVEGVLEIARELAGAVPVVVMCYSNLVRVSGVANFVDCLADAGAAGLLVPDEPMEEAAEVREACDAAGVALVPLVAPTTPDERLARYAEVARGFIYLVSVTGVTGERSRLPGELKDLVGRIRRHSDIPVAVGFGIGTPEQAREVSEVADGVIMGSRLVRAVAEASSIEEGLRAVGSFLRETATALEQD